MKLRHLTSSVVAVALAATPVLAQTEPARASAPAAVAENDMGGGPHLLWILGAIAVGLGIYFLFIDDDDSDSP